jgi:hypothetical protein
MFLPPYLKALLTSSVGDELEPCINCEKHGIPCEYDSQVGFVAKGWYLSRILLLLLLIWI